ncbi:helix-turn-helix domain-containing protein [Lachnospiraceae bacterium ASD3451]|uniref:helix-turn-helix transcriptional regulator n=1 Tax=Diplocloster agilis TaxID=2850323 RepID=UPI001DAB8E78|nr:helix-turn-helix transcriptional regulator [Diplocloster agilis]MBU9745161.1 helix-turn-helix domain-containing protein [Diplocloster agilis]
MKERLKQLRKALDFTQQQFADRIGIKRNSYANYETGRNTPIDAILISICREFDVNEDWLRDGIGEMFITRTRSEKITDFAADILKDEEESFRRKLIEALADLDVDEWELLEKIAEKAAQKRKS